MPEAEKDVADEVRTADGPLEPVGLLVARFFQFEGSGIGHLLTFFIHHAKVDKYGSVSASQVVEVFAGNSFAADGVEVDGIGEKTDVLNLLFQKAVDVLLMFEDQFLQMGVDLFMVRGTELPEDDAGDQNHGRKGDEYDQQHDVAGEGSVVRVQWNRLLVHTGPCWQRVDGSERGVGTCY